MVFSLTNKNIVLPSYRGRLTEGITYNKSNHSLLWVDIVVAEVHRYFFDSEVHEILKLDTPGDSIGTIGLTKDDNKIILCNKTGINIGDFVTKSVYNLKKYPENDKVRSNDGKIDPHGDLMVGTMSDFGCELRPEGTFYKLTHHDLKLLPLIKDVGISNGLGWNSSRTKFYWTDSPTGCVYKFDYDFESKTFSNKTVLFNARTLDPNADPCVPDGMCITDKDQIFISIYGVGMVVHVNEDGQILHKFKLPAEQITCCTVGGKDDDELFITTALPGAQEEHKPIDQYDTGDDLGGHLFLIKITDLNPGKEEQFIWGGEV